MSNQASITLTSASVQQSIRLEEVKDLLYYYKNITTKTGDQLNWHYSSAAFPYEIIENSDNPSSWFYLKGEKNSLYNYIIIGVDQHGENESDEGFSKIHIALSEISTHGDKGKANEICRFIASKLKGELTLFNGRVMHFNLKK
jgi:hypothetical protein